MRIAIDAMGNDNGSQIFIDAIKTFLSDHNDTEIVVFGDCNDFKEFKDDARVEVIHCEETINMDDGLLAIRRKKDASLNKMFDQLAEQKVDGGITAGSTAGLLTISILKIKTIEGIERPCFIATVPAKGNKLFQYLDMGANSDNTPMHLYQFAMMGKLYAQIVFNISDPKIQLLNIGAEKNKGDKLHKEAYQLLANSNELSFVGNVEGRDMFNGDADVIVTDGLSGNMTLKAVEGTASFAFGELKNIIYGSFINKLAGMILKKSLSKLKDDLDYSKYGGAILIGLEKPVVKAHGSSNAKAINSALLRLHTIIKNDTIEKMKRELK